MIATKNFKNIWEALPQIRIQYKQFMNNNTNMVITKTLNRNHVWIIYFFVKMK